MRLPDIILISIVLCLLLGMFCGCHGQWVKKSWDYEIGVGRTEYRSGYVKYKYVDPQTLWYWSEERNKLNTSQEDAVDKQRRILELMMAES